MCEEKQKYEVIDNGFHLYIEDTTLTEDKHEGRITDIYQLCRELNRLTEENERTEEALRKQYNYAVKQMNENKTEPVVYAAYNMLRTTIIDIAEYIGVYLDD